MGFTLNTVGNTAIAVSSESNPRINELAETFSDMARAHPDWMEDPLMGAIPTDYLSAGDRKNYYVGEGRLSVGDRFTRLDTPHPIQPAEIGEKPIVGIATKWSRSITIPRSQDLVSSYNSLETRLQALMGAARRQRMGKFLRTLHAVPVGNANMDPVVQVIVDVDGAWGFDNSSNAPSKTAPNSSTKPINIIKMARGYAGLMAAGAVMEGEMVYPIASYASWQQLRGDVLANHADRNRAHAEAMTTRASLSGFNPLVDLGPALLYKNFADNDLSQLSVPTTTYYDWLIARSAAKCLIPAKVPYINQYNNGSVENMPGTILEMYEIPEKDVFVAAVQCFEGFVVDFPNGLVRIQNSNPA